MSHFIDWCSMFNVASLNDKFWFSEDISTQIYIYIYTSILIHKLSYFHVDTFTLIFCHVTIVLAGKTEKSPFEVNFKVFLF